MAVAVGLCLTGAYDVFAGSGNFIRTGSWNQMDQRMMGPPVGRGGRGMGRAGSGNFDGFEGDRWGHKSLPPGPPPGVGSRVGTSAVLLCLQ